MDMAILSTSRKGVNTPDLRPEGAFAGGLLWGCGRGKGTRRGFGPSARGQGGGLGAFLGMHNRPEAKPLQVISPYRERLTQFAVSR